MSLRQRLNDVSFRGGEAGALFKADVVGSFEILEPYLQRGDLDDAWQVYRADLENSDRPWRLVWKVGPDNIEPWFRELCSKVKIGFTVKRAPALGGHVLVARADPSESAEERHARLHPVPSLGECGELGMYYRRLYGYAV